MWFTEGFSSDIGSGSGSMWGNIISDITEATKGIIGALRRPNATGAASVGSGASMIQGSSSGSSNSYGFMMIALLLVGLYFIFKK